MLPDGRATDGELARRDLLAATASGASVLVAGCASGAEEDDGGDGSGNSQSDTDDGSEQSQEETDTAPETSTPTETEPTEEGVDLPTIERRIHERVNQIRTANGVGLLEWDEDLREISRDHSEDMVRWGEARAVSPMGDDWGDRYQAANYECGVQVSGGLRDGGGNVAKLTYDQFPSPTQIAEEVVRYWREQERTALLATYWDVEGIGAALDRRDDPPALYLSQSFC